MSSELQGFADELQAMAARAWEMAESTEHKDLYLAWMRIRQAAVFTERAIPRDE